MADPVFRPGIHGLVPDAWIINANAPDGQPPVVVVHGIQRQVKEMAALLRRRAKDTRRTVILPHYDVQHWKRYQRAACPKRADVALLSLMRDLGREGRIDKGRFDLSGFSGGAQFSHRFAWMYPDAVGRLCLTAPGWWTFPDTQTAWPYGVGASVKRHGLEALWLRANLKRFLDREITVRVGSKDTTRDANLRDGPEIDVQQGRTRVDRARNWVSAMRLTARNLGVRPNISFKVLDDCGHNFADCVAQAQLDRLLVMPSHPCAKCRNFGVCPKSQTSKSIERSAA
jgi:pimeloyl-ACP methyl ester carboxylesterase